MLLLCVCLRCTLTTAQAKHYFLGTESFGEEPHRHVVVIRQADSRLPTATLGQVAHPNVPNAVGLAALHFSELTSNVRTHHLEEVLKPWHSHYKLKWIDDGNAIAVFAKESDARIALRTLGSHSPFKVSMFDDLSPSLYGSLVLNMGEQRSAARANADISNSDVRDKRHSKPAEGDWVAVAKGVAPSRAQARSPPPMTSGSYHNPYSILAKADDAWND